MNEKLKQLYQSVILQHNNHPVGYGKREGSAYTLDAYNPLCGDRFQLFFSLEDGRITGLGFHGYGCAISKAATSVLVKHLEGQPVQRALEMCRAFEAVVQPDAPAPSATEEDFEAFAAAREFPGRLKCATLSWEEISRFLEAQGVGG
ncbi:MAG: SUF system NifU family Fe-S cluster assembly protein [Phaeodactylibacter sp.]|nr:SUF system NifU family Fe-S cluster assembly protein [Phaeodactylibacter sp.]MCB9275149.1 SUF system NifU family Fe-S cluster assembly protein [Lewinellaceae bacterium]